MTRPDRAASEVPQRESASSTPEVAAKAPCPPVDEALGAITQIAARRWQPSAGAWAALLACLAVIAGWSVLPGPSLGDHECYVAQTSREMLADGDWVLPHFSGMPRLQKGPLAYWCVAGLATALGRLNDAVVRLPSGISGLALAAVMAILARRAFGTSGLAWFAAAVTGFSGAWIFHTHNGTVDMQLTFWCTLAGALFWLGVNSPSRPRRIALLAGLGAAFGMGMLAKMPMPAAVLLPGFLLYLLASGRGRRIGMYVLESLPGLAVMLLVWLPWIVMVLHRQEADAVGAKWYREFIGRFEGEIGAPTQAWYYYGPVLLWMALPWTLSLPEALAGPWLSRYRPWRDVLLLAFCIVAFNVVFFSAAGYKRPQYILPAMPWLLLLLTPPVWRFFAGPVYEHPRLFARLGVALAAAALVGCAAGWVGLWRYDPVIARRFLAPMAVLAGGLVCTGIVLALRARTEAMYALLLTITVTFCFGWMRSAQDWGGARQEQTFAQEFRRIVPAGAAAYYLARPDARLVYYGKMTLPRVLSDLDMLGQLQRRKMRITPGNGQILTALALVDLFRQDRPVYTVAEYWHWQELQSMPAFTSLQARILYRQPTFPDNPSKDWIVIGNRAAASNRPAS